jgi:hypothetical protein
MPQPENGSRWHVRRDDLGGLHAGTILAGRPVSHARRFRRFKDVSKKLPPEIETAVQPLMSAQGGIGSVEFLDLPRLVPDYVEKAIVFSPQARPALLVMIASRAYPDSVRDAFGRACAARGALGEGTTGAAVQVALCQGDTGGQSFAVVPYLSPISRDRLRRRWDRFCLRRPVFDWLGEVTRRTLVTPPETSWEDGFVKPLMALSRLEVVGERIRLAAGASLRALERRSWEPRWVLAHNDLWLGNLLRRRPDPAGMPGFAVIDWGASRLPGHPVYDFFSFANSIHLSAASLRRELRQYCVALGCEPGQSRHHLLVALGALSLTLGEWPVERFAATAQRYLTFVEGAE